MSEQLVAAENIRGGHAVIHCSTFVGSRVRRAACMPSSFG